MAKFKHYDYNQMSMVVINYLEQIQPGTFEFALHYLISEKLDLSAFHQPYKNDAEGRPAYDPAILLKIILFAYIPRELLPVARFARPKPFRHWKDKYGKRHQTPGKPKAKHLIPASEFQFDPVEMSCICPAGEQISHRGVKINDRGQRTAYFEGRLLQCRHCAINDKCMKNSASANHRKGAGRQVSFTLSDQRALAESLSKLGFSTGSLTGTFTCPNDYQQLDLT